MIAAKRRILMSAALAATLALWSADRAAAQSEIDDTKLEAFVVAALAVDKKIDEWQNRLTGAGNDEQAAQLREQANADIVDTIEQTDGITLQEYQEIRKAVAEDPKMLDRVTEIMRRQQQPQQ